MGKPLDKSAGKRLDVHNSEVPVVCRACEARHRGICGALSEEQLVRLSKHTTKRLHRVDEEIGFDGQQVRQYSNVLKGVVKLTKLMSDGRQQIVGLQFAPDFLGRPFRRESGITSEAATEVRLCTFPSSVIEEMITESPELEHKLHEQALRELDEAREWMLTLGRKSASEKVASFLYMIATHIDPEEDLLEGELRFELPLKRADIADFLGLTIETVSRQITNLRKRGIISLENNRTVVVPDIDALHRSCETSG